MKKLIVFIALMVLAIPAQAQDFGRSFEQLSEINRVNPLQNPNYERGKDVLRRKILDRKSKVIGEVKDINIRNNGTIETIEANFNRLRLSSDVPLNYRELGIDSRANTYVLRLDADDIQEFYPQLLANIDTAAGGDVGAVSVHDLQGAQLLSENGKRLGKVREVLFGSNGGRVDAIFVELSFGTMRGDTAAIPFRSVTIEQKNKRTRAIVPDSLVDALIEVADR